jgi:hypothetical protein
VPLPLPGEVRIHSPTRIHSGSPPHASPVIVDIWLHSGQHMHHLLRRRCGCNLHAGDTGRGNRACCGTCASGSLQLNNHAQFVGSASIDLRSRELKRRLSTPTIFEIYLQFMWMLRGCQCTVACMGLRSVCQSIIHACMHAVHMNPWKHACAQQQKWIGACNRASEHT